MDRNGTPDWSKPFGVTTPRVDTLGPQSPSDFPNAGHGPGNNPVSRIEDVLPVENEDRGQRMESDGYPTIWAAYELGY